MGRLIGSCIFSFWGACSPPCARPCAFIHFISFDFPFISFSFLFFIFFFTFIFFFSFPFSFHRHHHRQAGALAGAVDVEDLAVILKCPFFISFTFILFNAAQTKTKRNAIRAKSFPKFFRNWGSGGGVLGGARSHAPAPGPGDMPSHFEWIQDTLFRPGSAKLNARGMQWT